MPTTRKTRTSTGPAAKGSQKTLAFNNSKISKPSDKSFLKDEPFFKSEPLIKDEHSEDIKDIKPFELDLGHISSAPAVEVQAKIELAKPRTAEEEKASKITDAQIRKYWKAREAERKAPRVHQEDLSVEEKVLRLFDISSQYGPCIGIARMKRWVRANKLGLAPPIEVLAVLLKEEGRGNVGIERAYVDELMNSKQSDA